MKGSRNFVRRTRLRRSKNPTWLEDVVLVHTHVLLYVYDAEKVVHGTRTKVRYKIALCTTVWTPLKVLMSCNLDTRQIQFSLQNYFPN